ncbi:nucleotidyltransferase domain-containing protein [Chitinophaga sp. sic0106]|uniref:nucleotidyltransferase domain-containing protein n=1 Tax=Chitinophaga sp. sic0106 TaxID=2854785 RepID=UPI001C49743B|nr:nucleotidyltransferase domain-containing protein [Chitinophaga sp. sic0106]MBV7533142.1 nucleotidyltransferase domain-containing protein [Chitinophaga sp. sic0106]
MEPTIQQQLRQIEQQEGVRILMAIESGSRAWGFASPDSDYDVRFIYQRPGLEYLSIHDRKDVIEIPVDEVLDINGWDIRKALQLFLKSNSPLYEWLQSPIIYREDTDFAAELRSLMNEYYSHRAGCHHYFSMARNTFEQSLQTPEVKLKKYFYALRPLLAGMWILDKKTVPPIEFGALRTLITDQEWHQAVDALLLQKKAADEKTLVPPVPFLQQWISTNLVAGLEKANNISPVQHTTAQLDEIFRKYIRHDL